ncbi:hypothetical protein AAW12_08165 [Sphingobacterium sp. Ag1]|nr:hypothetical protein AAW12_08165 [Sphingobacterium sp. Ag1]
MEYAGNESASCLFFGKVICCVPTEMLERVFSVYFNIAFLLSIIGVLFTGSIADAIGCDGFCYRRRLEKKIVL